MNFFLAHLLSRAFDGALAPAHRDDLRRSGLTDETIGAQFIRSVPPAMIPRLLRFDIPAIRSACLFPFRSPAGGFMPQVRVKIFPTLLRVNRKGKTGYVPDGEQSPDDVKEQKIKYLQPKGSAPRLYFVASRLRDVLEGSEPLWICEGEKKTCALAQLGFAVVGICGIEGWHAGGTPDLLPDFDAILLRDRVVEVLPDGDFQTNPAVERAVRRLGLALSIRGARPRAVLLPSETKAP